MPHPLHMFYGNLVQLGIKRIFHGVMVRIGKVEPEGWPARSGPSFSDVQITGLPEGSTFPILTNDPVIDYFFLPINFNWSFDAITQRFSTRLRRMTLLLCSVATLRRSTGSRPCTEVTIGTPRLCIVLVNTRGVSECLGWKIRFFHALANLGIPLSDR